MKVFLNGKFVDQHEAKISVFDHGFLYGDGIYETMRTYGSKLWNFSAHFKRLENSAELLLLKIPYSENEVNNYIEELIRQNGLSESRVRITLTRGVSHFDFSECETPTFCVSAGELSVGYKSVFKNGIDVISVPFHRVVPEIKSISLLAMVRAQQMAKRKGAYEALFVNERGYITEGSRTNAYFVLNGVIYVPEIDMLPGTTRELLLRMAGSMGFDVVFKPCDKEAFYEASEIFLSNAVYGIIPVKKIDDFVVNGQVPGPITKQLMVEWNNRIKNFIDAE